MTALLGVLTVAMSLLGAIAYGFAIVRPLALRPRRPGQAIAKWFWPVVPLALGVALSLPTTWRYPRMLLVGLSIVMMCKTWDLIRGHVRDPAVLRHPWTFALWFLCPPAPRLPRSQTEADQVRAGASRRLGRGLTKLVVASVVLLLGASAPWIHERWLLGTEWAMWLLYLGFTGFADLVTGGVMALGFDLDEVFESPPLATSPRDFWSRRWNLYIHGFAERNVYIPLGGRQAPVRNVLLVFGLSGLMHEYLIAGTLGTAPEHLGFMLLFFGLQGLAVIVEVGLTSVFKGVALPRPLAVALHHGWLLLTAPLFFAPLAELFG